MKKLIRIIETISENSGTWTSWLTTVLVLLICYDVFMRYVFGETAIWITELEWHLFALIFLFAAGYAFKHERHVRIDLFYANWPEKRKAWVNLAGTILLLFPWCLIIIMGSYDYAMSSYQIRETSPDPGGLPARYLIKFAITIGFVLLFLQGIAFVLRQMLILFFEEDLPEDRDKEITTSL